MIADLRQWLDRVWPSLPKRQAVLGGYAVLGREKPLLADIALRGQVFGPCHVPGDPYTSAVNEGRRQLALELIKLAGEDPQRIYSFIERPASPDTPRRL